MEGLLRYAGKIAQWNDDRGFGFVVPHGGGDRAFVHISEFKGDARRPSVDDRVTYSVARDSRGRLQAKAVRLAEVERAGRPQASGLPRTAIGILALAVVAAGFVAGLLPVLVAAAYFAVSCVSFLACMHDKGAAKRNAWRTQESTLHLLDLLGGWPGGLIAQQTFHHKTSKQTFQLVFGVCVVVNIGAVWWLITSGLAARFSALVLG